MFFLFHSNKKLLHKNGKKKNCLTSGDITKGTPLSKFLAKKKGGIFKAKIVFRGFRKGPLVISPDY